MRNFRLRSTILIACVVAGAGPGHATASSIASSYTLTDLGPTPNVVNNGQPLFSGNVLPQIDDSGKITYANPGYNNAGIFSSIKAGVYSITNDGEGMNGFVYNAPGSRPVYLYVNEQTASQQNDPILGTESYATGINASGTAIGFARRDQEAFVYRPGGPTAPGQTPGLSLIPGIVPGTYSWYALGINSAGLIVGQAPGSSTDKVDPYGGLFTDSGGRATIFDGTKTVDLNTLIGPGSSLMLSAATSINDLGQIVGFANSSQDTLIHAFLLTPTATPEPGAWVLGIVAIGFAGMRRLTSR